LKAYSLSVLNVPNSIRMNGLCTYVMTVLYGTVHCRCRLFHANPSVFPYTVIKLLLKLPSNLIIATNYPQCKQTNFSFFSFFSSGPGPRRRLATHYRLDGPGIESWGARLFASIQMGLGAHPVSYTYNGYRVFTEDKTVGT
jgi:hypothetical protein